MFNLEQAIADWRRQMMIGGIQSIEVLDELESHLRDEIERQIESGADKQRAFESAIAGLGQAAALRIEFAKIKPANDPSRLILSGFYFGCAVFVLVVNTWNLLEMEMGSLQRALGFFAISIIALYLICLPHLLNRLQAPAYDRLLKVLKLGSSLVWLWPAWALLEATQKVNAGIGVVPAMVLWCLTGAIGLTVLACGLNQRRGPRGGQGGPPPPLAPNPQAIPPMRPVPPEFELRLPGARPFAPVAREALEAAGEEAARLGHDFIGTEHVLLGMLKLATGAFAELLQRLQVDRELVRVEIERMVPAVPLRAGRRTVPLTPRAHKALRLAAKEARSLKQPCVGAEHIFLGLLLEGSGVAAQVLGTIGIRFKSTRKALARCNY